MEYTADFETIKNDDGSMRVWLADLCEVETLTHHTFVSLDDFFGWLFEQGEDCILHFHNLKFDGSYIIPWCNAKGYTYFDGRKNQPPLTYNFLVTDKSQWFMGRIVSASGMVIDIRDSLKKIPQKVADIAKAYDLPILKGEIDYAMQRPIGYQPTDIEIAYIHNDTEIVARALKIHYAQGMTKLTAPADAMQEFRQMYKDHDRFMVSKYWATHPNVERFCRQGYVGGISWVNPDIIEAELSAGVVYDYNSMYPSVMLKYPIPFGYPIQAYGGLPKGYTLGIYRYKLDIIRKAGHLATFRNPEINTWENGEYAGYAVMTTVDADLVMQNYYGSIEMLDGYAFKGVRHVFDDYINKWGAIKVKAGQDGNKALKTIAKLFLNSLYGKFGTNPERCHKIPYFVDEVLKWECGESEMGRAFDVAVAAFITAYARKELSEGAMSSNGLLAYVDTDSLHFVTDHDDFDPARTDPQRLGYWKKESEFVRAKYLRQKTYIEQDANGELTIAACGCPDGCRKYITFDNFEIGAKFPGKLKPVQRVGGCELVETDFTIRVPLWS